MKIYKTQSEVEKDIKNGVLAIGDDVTFECSISIDASINANNINACDIDACDINAHNIDAFNIKACNIKANNIDACDINAHNIDACDISYYAFCSAYNSIKCSSIKARRENHSEPICLDGKLEIKEQEDYLEAIKILEEKGYKIVKK